MNQTAWNSKIQYDPICRLEAWNLCANYMIRTLSGPPTGLWNHQLEDTFSRNDETETKQWRQFSFTFAEPDALWTAVWSFLTPVQPMSNSYNPPLGPLNASTTVPNPSSTNPTCKHASCTRFCLCRCALKVLPSLWNGLRVETLKNHQWRCASKNSPFLSGFGTTSNWSWCGDV